MAQRRPLIAGINAPENADPDAVRAFVSQERPLPEARDEKRELAIVRDREPELDEVLEGAQLAKKKGRGRVPVGLIPITVRLRPEIAGALKRASLERQLAGEDVYTQQDLVEQALEPWLRSEGYL
jgi:hypothetical protein